VVQKRKFESPKENEERTKWLISLLELYETEKQILVSGNYHKVSFLGMLKWIIGHNFEGQNQILRNLLLDSILSAKMVAGSGVYVPWFLYNKLENFTVERLSSVEYLDITVEKTRCKEVQDIFYSIWEIAGPLTKIIVKPSEESDSLIKYKNSFNFPMKLDPQFHRMLGYTDYIDLNDPIVVMIEGAPETVGEINSLLQWNHEVKRPVVLVARSFPEEISATLATNWRKNSLNVLPFLYGDSIETINLAADLCSVTGGELISSHFGDIIPAVIMNRDKWGTIDKLEWSTDQLLITKENCRPERQIKNILQKIKNAEEQELKDVLQARLLCLSNDAIEVWISKEKIQVLEELEEIIKHYNAFVATGCVKTSLGYIPRSFVDVAQTTAESLRKEILNIGGFLVRADDEMVA